MYKFDNDMVFKLLELYQERKSLWDTNHSLFKDKTIKNREWSEIARTLNVDQNVVERKMKSLRTMFQREMCRKNSESKWFAYKKMLFLKPYYVPRKFCEIHSILNMEQDLDDDNDTNDGCDDVTETYVLDETKSDSANSSRFFFQHEPQLSVPQQISPTIQRETTAAKHQRSQNTNYDENGDEFDTFGKNVAQQLRTLPLAVALETQEMVLSVIRKQRIKVLNGDIQIVHYDPLLKRE